MDVIGMIGWHDWWVGLTRKALAPVLAPSPTMPEARKSSLLIVRLRDIRWLLTPCMHASAVLVGFKSSNPAISNQALGIRLDVM